MSEEINNDSRWIPTSEQKPPLIHEAAESDGFFLLLRHNPQKDAVNKYRIHLWYGSAPIDSAYWMKIPKLPNT